MKMHLAEALNRGNANSRARALTVYVKGEPNPVDGFFVTMAEARRLGAQFPEILLIKHGASIVYAK